MGQILNSNEVDLRWVTVLLNQEIMMRKRKEKKN